MKKRYGFVSNSSSSSFVCEVCGKEDSGYDANPRDFDMAICMSGHTFCYDHAINPDKPSTVTFGDSTMTYEDMFDAEDIEGEVPEQYCPICNFVELSSYDYLSYLKKTGRGTDEIFKEIKSRFHTYKEFTDFLRSDS